MLPGILRRASAALPALLLLGLSATGPALAEGPTDSNAPPLAEALAALRARYGQALPVLDASDFRHPAERQIVKTLMETNPGIRELVDDAKKAQVKQVEDKDSFYMVNAVQVGPKQYPAVFEVASKAARTLGLGDNFKLFILNDPQMQTDVFGFVRHDHYGNSFSNFSVRINSGLVKALTPAELAFAIGREFGHIKANHRFYSALMWSYQGKSGKLPKLYPGDKAEKAPGMGGALKLLFEKAPEPSRISEFTADRAGLIACGDVNAAYSALAKLSAGDLEGHGAVDVEAFLNQARTVTSSLDPERLAEVLKSQGYQPFTLTRVRELSDFAGSSDFLAATGRVGDPFQSGLSALYELSADLADGRQRLEAFDKDPKTLQLDPLARDAMKAALKEAVDKRVAPVNELEELLNVNLITVGLTGTNPSFDVLIAFAKRKPDARPLAGLLQKLADKLTYYVSRPDLSETERKLAQERLNQVKGLLSAAPPKVVRGRAVTGWVEPIDLAAALQKPLTRLKDEAASGDKESFFGTVTDLQPMLKATFLSLVTQLGAEHAAGLIEYAAPVRGEAALAAEQLRAAGTDAVKLGALFDRYFNEYSGFLKKVPFFIVKRYLKNLDIPVAAH